jgi:hypothetical protein
LPSRLILFALKIFLMPGVVAHIYNPNTWKLKQKDHVFKASLGYMSRHCLGRKKKS